MVVFDYSCGLVVLRCVVGVGCCTGLWWLWAAVLAGFVVVAVL